MLSTHLRVRASAGGSKVWHLLCKGVQMDLAVFVIMESSDYIIRAININSIYKRRALRSSERVGYYVLLVKGKTFNPSV